MPLESGRQAWIFSLEVLTLGGNMSLLVATFVYFIMIPIWKDRYLLRIAFLDALNTRNKLLSRGNWLGFLSWKNNLDQLSSIHQTFRSSRRDRALSTNYRRRRQRGRRRVCCQQIHPRDRYSAKYVILQWFSRVTITNLQLPSFRCDGRFALRDLTGGWNLVDVPPGIVVNLSTLRHGTCRISSKMAIHGPLSQLVRSPPRASRKAPRRGPGDDVLSTDAARKRSILLQIDVHPGGENSEQNQGRLVM